MNKASWRGLRIAILLLCLASVCGCGIGRTQLVTDDVPLRTGPDVKGRVFVLTEGQWRLGDSPVTIPAGWYIVPPRFVDPDDLPP